MKKYFDVFVYTGFFVVLILLSLVSGSSVDWHWHLLNVGKMSLTFLYLVSSAFVVSLPSLLITFIENRRG